MVKKFVATLSNGTTRLFEGVSFKDAWNHARAVVKPEGLKLTDFRLEGKIAKVAPKMLKKTSGAVAKKAAVIEETVDGVTISKPAKSDMKAPASYFRPIKYQVSDPNDPHHYEFVEERFDTEVEREKRVHEIMADKKLTFISRGQNYRKFEVQFWKQID